MTERVPSNRPRRAFSSDYKHEATRLIIDTGHVIAEVARELGAGYQSLGKWVAAELYKDNEFPGKATAFSATKQRPRNGTN